MTVKHYHDDDCPASRNLSRWASPECICKGEIHLNTTDPREPLTREKVRAIEMGSPTADANEEPWDIGDLCQSHELLRARLERAEQDIADARADWTKQRHRAEKAERERDEARSSRDYEVECKRALAARLEAARARIRVLETECEAWRALDWENWPTLKTPTETFEERAAYQKALTTLAAAREATGALSPDPEVKP